MSYNGYKNWNQWNVCLWIHNDEQLYTWATRCVKLGGTKPRAVDIFLKILENNSMTETPDGAKYTRTNVRHAFIGM